MGIDENPEEGATPDPEATTPEADAAVPEPEVGTPASERGHVDPDFAPPALAPPLHPGGELRVWAVLAHLLAIAGYMTSFGLLGWVGPLSVWIKQRKSDPFVAFHALQSLFFQLIWTGLLFVGIRLVWLKPDLFLGWLLSSAVPVIWCVVAALRAHQGEWYQYPLVGHWALDLTEQATHDE
jgi:uncharacterized Tic20 family protein